MGGIRSDPPKLAGEDSNGEDKKEAESKTVIRQPDGKREGQEGGSKKIPKSVLLKQEAVYKTDEGIAVKQPSGGMVDSDDRRRKS